MTKGVTVPVPVREGLQMREIDATLDEHVFVVVRTPERPTVSIDIANGHGRRFMSVRVNGMTIGSLLLDVSELPPLSGRFQRFCSFCGEEYDLFSSKGHVCTEDK